ncbi:MAG: tRNA (adenosine(37)-N6)-threonylcarbamoyltransferase complex transferase subunit TsaD [Patescibacteria group bacterium]|nr:tRNA (adenosine(37)-N6)-threonylcarbamoyltransferase complex transferase subunit TsaD [Patescibacteria group bacterium]MDD4303941.1 tRNA (adenosine(37)-N6)-threonylcarbamoyltransferase complex transferase subunit TsaD [Patescibacteria group bacterium]MDD4695071.1 tRNA (adenosine(37)-N6)-threonylcarbamoyltransferase complex transferase subunit TsaD [Patescibacteria group bacterium]
MKILGIESSCDESALSLIEIDKNNKITLLKNLISSQIEIHKQYGGIVPEVAARCHAENFFPLLKKLDIDIARDVDLIAVTYGPGLITSLIIGLELAKTLSYIYKKPLIEINHIEAHIYSNWLTYPELFNEKTTFPALAVVISGGHTQIFLMKDYGKYKLLGATVDDAVGEAYDKVAKILELGYPGGPIINKLASEYSKKPSFEFPRPMLNTKDYNFSFSGLKTSILYKWRDDPSTSLGPGKKNKVISEYCKAFENAICDVLSKKIISAAKNYNVKNIILGGGVSANSSIKSRIKADAEKLSIKTYFPELKHTGDNAAMVAVAGYFNRNRARKNNFKITADSNLSL